MHFFFNEPTKDLSSEADEVIKEDDFQFEFHRPSSGKGFVLGAYDPSAKKYVAEVWGKDKSATTGEKNLIVNENFSKDYLDRYLCRPMMSHALRRFKRGPLLAAGEEGEMKSEGKIERKIEAKSESEGKDELDYVAFIRNHPTVTPPEICRCYLDAAHDNNLYPFLKVKRDEKMPRYKSEYCLSPLATDPIEIGEKCAEQGRHGKDVWTYYLGGDIFYFREPVTDPSALCESTDEILRDARNGLALIRRWLQETPAQESIFIDRRILPATLFRSSSVFSSSSVPSTSADKPSLYERVENVLKGRGGSVERLIQDMAHIFWILSNDIYPSSSPLTSRSAIAAKEYAKWSARCSSLSATGTTGIKGIKGTEGIEGGCGPEFYAHRLQAEELAERTRYERGREAALLAIPERNLTMGQIEELKFINRQTSQGRTR